MFDAIVVGSGAGGSVTAFELASSGARVLVIEEGPRARREDYGAPAPSAMEHLYRRRGMTPILGRVPIGYVEGCCVGGSTEINSGFWHRPPAETLLRWQAKYDLAGSSPEALAPHLDWLERRLCVGPFTGPWPPSTRVFAAGAERMGWSFREVPRTADGCSGRNACPSGCPTGAKRGVGHTIVPLAEELGARVLPNCRAKLILTGGRRATGVLVERRGEQDQIELLRIDGRHVFVCAGPTETPALLRRSGIRYNVGQSLCLHPMLKVAARFPEPMQSQQSVLPLIQLKEFGAEISIGGAYFSFGHLALVLSENWRRDCAEMRNAARTACYYVAVRGCGNGSVRSSFLHESPLLRYELSEVDVWNLSRGLARLAMLLLAAGAEVVIPTVTGVPPIRRNVDAARWLDEALPRSGLALTTVHAFSTCPIGERLDRCAADSYGRLHGLDNVFINDGSMLPDSPGVNPQGTIMALARRNVAAFLGAKQ